MKPEELLIECLQKSNMKPEEFLIEYIKKSAVEISGLQKENKRLKHDYEEASEAEEEALILLNWEAKRADYFKRLAKEEIEIIDERLELCDDKHCTHRPTRCKDIKKLIETVYKDYPIERPRTS